MIRPTDIHTISDFQRNTKDYVQQVIESKHPLALTVNGTAQIVVQDAATFEAMVDELEQSRFVNAIHEAEQSLREKGARPASDAFADLRARHNL